MKDLRIIAFDADDTLWINEPFFRETEQKFCELLEDFLPQHTIVKELYRVETENMSLYGYGIKAFILSLIETAAKITNNTVRIDVAEKIIGFGKEMLNKPVELLDGVQEVLDSLYSKYTLIMATKGDLLDQQRKLKKSKLENYFSHIEVMPHKEVPDYRKLLGRLDCSPTQFLMLGNSIKSDILPVLELGGYAAHIPFHVTWEFEHAEYDLHHPRFFQLQSIKDILPLL